MHNTLTSTDTLPASKTDVGSTYVGSFVLIGCEDTEPTTAKTSSLDQFNSTRSVGKTTSNGLMTEASARAFETHFDKALSAMGDEYGCLESWASNGIPADPQVPSPQRIDDAYKLMEQTHVARAALSAVATLTRTDTMNVLTAMQKMTGPPGHAKDPVFIANMRALGELGETLYSIENYCKGDDSSGAQRVVRPSDISDILNKPMFQEIRNIWSKASPGTTLTDTKVLKPVHKVIEEERTRHGVYGATSVSNVA